MRRVSEGQSTIDGRWRFCVSAKHYYDFASDRYRFENKMRPLKREARISIIQLWVDGSSISYLVSFNLVSM